MNPRRRIARRGVPRGAAIAGLVVLAATTAVLAGWAVGFTRTPSELGGTVPELPTIVPPEPTPSETSAPPVPVAAVFLTAVDGQTALFARAGDCRSAPPEILATTDGGGSWVAYNGSQVGLGQVVSLQLQSDTIALTVFRTAGTCELSGGRSFTGGQFWEEYPELPMIESYLDPADPRTVVIDGQAVPSPCAHPIQVAEGGDSDVVLCDGGDVHEFIDGGWTVTNVPGAYAMGIASGSAIFAVDAAAGCDGVQLRAALRPLSAGGLEDRACLSTDPQPGTTALSVADDAVWFATVEGTRRSLDGGANW